jgi:aminopeptidase C
MFWFKKKKKDPVWFCTEESRSIQRRLGVMKEKLYEYQVGVPSCLRKPSRMVLVSYSDLELLWTHANWIQTLEKERQKDFER